MDRDLLLAALADAGDTAELCRAALLANADLRVLPGTVPTADLRSAYRSRAEHLAQQGSDDTAIGAAEVADRLERTDHVELVVARVSGGSTASVFQVFLDPGQRTVVACLAVSQG